LVTASAKYGVLVDALEGSMSTRYGRALEADKEVRAVHESSREGSGQNRVKMSANGLTGR
jgi:hypothetical protein